MKMTHFIKGDGELWSIRCLNFYLLIASCKLRLCPAKEVSDEVSLTAHMDVAFMGATA